MRTKIDYYLENTEKRLQIAKNAKEKLSKLENENHSLYSIVLDSAIIECYRRNNSKKYVKSYRKKIKSTIYKINPKIMDLYYEIKNISNIK